VVGESRPLHLAAGLAIGLRPVLPVTAPGTATCWDSAARPPQLPSWSEDNKLQSNHQMGCFKRMEVRGQNVEAKLRQEQP
jgi:hypothetical protein